MTTQHRLLFSGDHEFWRPEQGALELGVREYAEGIACGFGVTRRLGGGELQRTITVEDGQDVRMSNAIESAFVQNGLDLAALGRGAMLQRMNDRHGGFAFSQVAGNGLAQHAL